MGELLSTDEAGEILDVGAARVRQLVRHGILPATRKGRTILLDRDDVEQYAALPRGVPGRPRRLPKR